MNPLIVNDAALAILRQATEPTEIRDNKGALIGYFAPAATDKAQMYIRAMARYDPEEIARRKADPRPALTTREVFEHLKSLTQDEQERAYLQQKIDRLAKEDRCATPSSGSPQQ